MKYILIALFLFNLAYGDCEKALNDPVPAGCFHECRESNYCGGKHYYYCCNICDYWEDEGCEYAGNYRDEINPKLLRRD